MTVGRLVMALLGAGVIFNQVMFHLINGETNPFQCEQGWCIVTGLIYLSYNITLNAIV